MWLAGVTVTAGLVSIVPSTRTRPSAIQRSASRREHRPARAITLAIRSPAAGAATLSSSLIVSRRGGADERREDAEIAGADRVFRVPLDAEAEAAAGILDTLDDAVRRGGVDDHPRCHRLHRLMMGRVDRQLAHPGDAVEERAGDDRDGMPGFGARIRLLMRQCARDLVGNVLDQRPAERDVKELLAAADPEHGLVG